MSKRLILINGIVKKGWVGAARTDKDKQSFIDWLDGLT